MNDLRTTYGQDAVVTWASSRIGEQFARQPAAAGVNLARSLSTRLYGWAVGRSLGDAARSAL